jgi:CRP/FNR family transcriptional regulator, cyclic AMP receptor protein
MDHRPRRGTDVAIDHLEALVVPGPQFQRLVAQYGGLSSALGRVLSTKLAESDGYRVATGSAGIEARLARLLLNLARRYGHNERDGRSIGLPLTQDDLAQCHATSQRTIARTLSSWRRGNVVRTGRRAIVLTQEDVLHRLSEVRA